MPVKHKKKLLLALPAFMLAYLAIAACWAWASFDQAMAGAGAPPAAQLSPRQAAILLLVEDPTFLTHRGVSLAPGQGLATISSAVARDVYLGGARFPGAAGALQTLYRGVFDCCKKVDFGRDAMAVVLDARLSKQAQLALYVSQVYMGTHEGRQIRGLPQAAESYLGKPLEATTVDEFIGLAAMIKAPNSFHPLKHPDAYDLRVARVRALVAGSCRPAGWFDTQLAHCSPGAPGPASPTP
jgi:membrane carboxypeptidase/penicillin-binding protein